jgi:hypothetical protein
MLSVFYTAARFCLVHVTLILEVKYISFCEKRKTVSSWFNICIMRKRMVIMEQWSFSFSITLVQYFKKWPHGIDHRFRTLISVGVLAVLFSRSAYVEMIKYFQT